MEIFTVEFGSTFFFLSAMLLVARFKEEICKIDKPSFTNISIGLSIFSAVSLMVMYRQTGMMIALPFLNVPIFFDLVTYIAIISGSVMVVSGVGAWIPLMRELKSINRSNISQLSMIKKISRLSKIEARVEVLVSTFKNYVADEYNFSSAALFLVSPQKERSILHNATGEMFDREDSLKMIEFDFQALSSMENIELSLDRISKNYPPNMEPPQLILPLFRKNRVVSVLMFWNDKKSETVLCDRSELEIPLEMLSKRISELTDDIEDKFNSTLEDSKEAAILRLKRAVDVKEKLSIIAAALKDNCKADFVSLIDFTNPMISTRYSVGTNQSVLQELKVRLSLSQKEMEQIFSDKDYISVTEATSEADEKYQKLISNPHAKSMIMFPVMDNHRLVGLFAVASKEKNKVGAREKYVAESFLSMITYALLEDQKETESTAQLIRMKKLREFINCSKETDDLSEIINLSAAAVIDDPSFDIVRISTFDKKSRFLDSVALLMSQKMNPRVPTNGHQILSLMPSHAKMQEKRETIIVDQNNQETSLESIEMNQSLALEITNAILQPVIVNDRVTAVVAAGNSRSLTVSNHESEFIKALSAVLAMHFRFDNIRNVLTAKDSSVSSVNQTTYDTHNREQLNDALSGIIGSIDQLDDKEMNEHDRQQLLKKISTSAGSLNDYVTEAD